MRSDGRCASWRTTCLALVIGACLVTAHTARAKINPGFSPRHLGEQSKLILVLKLRLAGKKAVSLKVSERLKGEAPKQALSLSLRDTRKEQAEAFLEVVRVNKGGPVLLFAGKYVQEGAGGEGGGDPGMGEGEPGGPDRIPNAMLHVYGRWFTLAEAKGGVLHVIEINDYLQETWAGSTDMLLRCTRYVLTDPHPVVPPTTGAVWEEPYEKIGKLNGRAYGALGVDLRGDGRTCLHVLAENGDRVLLHNKTSKKFDDLTAKLKLGAKSKAAAWGDFNADGTLDLASWDGKALSFWLQARDGTFSRKPAGMDLKGDCSGLAVVGLGDEGRAGLVVSGEGVPRLLVPKGGGAFFLRPIVPAGGGKWPGQDLGPAWPCLVADFDGDALPDVLQPCENGILFYKATRPGEFSSPTVDRDVRTDKNHARALTGDFDHDGRLDVFVAAEEGCHLWDNLGGGKFARRLHFTGEMAYISKDAARSSMVCDINNDGRQDVFITYANILPQLFFNRGFRSFGHSHALDLAEKDWLPLSTEEQKRKDDEEDEVGEEAGLVNDLDGDGAQDMFFVFSHHRRKRGDYPKEPGPWREAPHHREMWVCWQSRGQGSPLAVRAALPPDGPAGPVRVTAWNQKRCLGAWNVSPGMPGAFFGRREAGPCKLRWQFPGKKPVETEIIVEDVPVRVLLGPAGRVGAKAGAGAADPRSAAAEAGRTGGPAPDKQAQEESVPGGLGRVFATYWPLLAGVAIVLVVVVFAVRRRGPA